MHKFICLFMSLLFLMTGCSTSQNPDNSNSTDDLGSYFENQPQTGEIGSANFGFVNSMDTVYTYTGEPLEIPFHVIGASEGAESEIGVFLFVDGVVQPYSIVYEDGTSRSEDSMQVFCLDYEEKESFNMVFQPVTGKAGETLSLMAVTILNPSFVAEGENNPRYGIYHGESATTDRNISFDVDAPAQTLSTATTEYDVKEIHQEIMDRLAAWGALDQLDMTATLELDVGEENIIRADGKRAEVTVQLYGGPEANFNITFFVNHKPVKINEADYISVRTEKNKMIEFTVQLDTTDLGELNTVYAIAVTARGDHLLEINNPVKTTSILLVNKES